MKFEELVPDQGELAFAMEFNQTNEQITVQAYAPLPQHTNPPDIAAAYFTLCDSNTPALRDLFFLDTSANNRAPAAARKTPPYTILHARTPLAIFAGKKYKPIALKFRPVETELPSRFRIIRTIKGDPLENMPKLPTHPPAYKPTGRYTEDRKEIIDRAHPGNFLLPEERALMHHLMSVQNDGFTWCDPERGHFCEDFFPPIEVPTIPHRPWAQRNIPIPPGIYEEVCRLIKTKIEAGVYEPSNSSYRSRWFCVVKKDRKSLRIVHSLEPLNKVTIKHAGVTPFTHW